MAALKAFRLYIDKTMNVSDHEPYGPMLVDSNKGKPQVQSKALSEVGGTRTSG